MNTYMCGNITIAWKQQRHVINESAMQRIVRRRRCFLQDFCILLSLAALFGCGAMPNGRGWGQDATLVPGWSRISAAAWNAVAAPETWAPAAGALALQVGHADRNISEWASRQNPLFGTKENAGRMSDNLAQASEALWAASIVTAPSGTAPDEWIVSKARGLGIQAGTSLLLSGTVGLLKDAADRTRPDGSDKTSFPSGHASLSSLYNTMACKNIETFGWSDMTLTAARLGFGALTAATAWARVEAEKHYPSDVLAGIALGHFFGAFFTDAFLGLDSSRMTVLVEPSREGIFAAVRIYF